jgi:putative flippase GtrA
MIWTKQFASYAIIGLVSNGLGFLCFAALTWLGMGPASAISIVYLGCVALTFIFNKSLSFNHKGRISTSAVKYLFSYSACYVLNVAVLKFFSGYLGYSHLAVQAIAIFVIALLLFIAQKFWVFRTPDISIPGMQAL